MDVGRLVTQVAVATSVVAALAWFVGLTISPSKATLRHSVWRIALAAFWLVPAAVLAALALHVQIWPAFLASVGVSASAPAVASVGADAVRTSLRGLAEVDVAPSLVATAARTITPFALILVVWALGGALGVMRVGRTLGATRRLARAADSIREEGLCRRLAEWSKVLGLQEPPRVAASPEVTVPGLSGWRRPVLLLPQGFSRSDPSCDSVLVHELAHVRRHDVLAQTAAEVTCALWWWHPIAWLVRRGLHVSAQEACDDWALALVEQRERYAAHLVRWAEVAGAGMATAYASRGRLLVGRVRRVLSQTSRPQVGLSRKARLILVVATVLAVVAGGIVHPQATVAALPVGGMAPLTPDSPAAASAEADVTIYPTATAPVAQPVPVQGAMVISRPDHRSTLVKGSSEGAAPLPLAFDQADLSPDGTKLAYIDPWGPWPPSSRNIWRAGLDGSDKVNLTEKAGVSGVNCAPCWAPDGKMIAFHHSEVEPGQLPCLPGWEVWVMAADGSNARRVLSAAEAGMPGQPLWFPRWTRDGRRLYCQTHGGVIEVNLDGSLPHVLVPLWGQVDLSPDGKRALLARSMPGEVQARPGLWRQLILVDVKTGAQKVLVQQFVDQAEAEAHLARVVPEEEGGAAEVSRVTGPDRPRWSPDGKQVAFVAAVPFRPDGSPFRKQTEVWIYDLETRKLHRVTDDDEQEDWLSWR